MLASTAYGLSVGLDVPTDEVDQARPWLPWWWRDEDTDPAFVWHAHSAVACEQLVGELELWVAEHARGLIFVHAGVVYVDGFAVLLPGRSFSGKSTLVSALVDRGALYGSDEYAVISADGFVHPYPRPISLRDEDGSRPRITVPRSQIGRPGRVSMVAHVAYRPEAEPDLRPIVASQSLLRLLDNTVAAQSRTEESLSALIEATKDASAVAGTRGSAEAAADELLTLVG